MIFTFYCCCCCFHWYLFVFALFFLHFVTLPVNPRHVCIEEVHRKCGSSPTYSSLGTPTSVSSTTNPWWNCLCVLLALVCTEEVHIQEVCSHPYSSLGILLALIGTEDVHRNHDSSYSYSSLGTATWALLLLDGSHQHHLACIGDRSRIEIWITIIDSALFLIRVSFSESVESLTSEIKPPKFWRLKW